MRLLTAILAAFVTVPALAGDGSDAPKVPMPVPFETFRGYVRLPGEFNPFNTTPPMIGLQTDSRLLPLAFLCDRDEKEAVRLGGHLAQVRGRFVKRAAERWFVVETLTLIQR